MSRSECAFGIVCDEGPCTDPCSCIRHGLKRLQGCLLSICHLHAWPKPCKMTAEGVLYGLSLGIRMDLQCILYMEV